MRTYENYRLCGREYQTKTRFKSVTRKTILTFGVWTQLWDITWWSHKVKEFPFSVLIARRSFVSCPVYKEISTIFKRGEEFGGKSSWMNLKNFVLSFDTVFDRVSLLLLSAMNKVNQLFYSFIFLLYIKYRILLKNYDKRHKRSRV